MRESKPNKPIAKHYCPSQSFGNRQKIKRNGQTKQTCKNEIGELVLSREKLLELTRSNLEKIADYAEDGPLPLADDIYRVPTANYYDPGRWESEMELIFKRLPLVLGFTSEIPKKGDYKALEVAGVPLIMVRGKDGRVRGFVNMCSHRGAQIVDEGLGNKRSFSCPYHAWTYDLTGELIAILDEQDFGEVDASCLGLTPINIEEKVGIIWGCITPGVELHLDAFLAGYDDLLANHDLENCVFVGQQTLMGPNWKVAFDGYIDFYHLPILHKNTFGSQYNNKSIFNYWGPHQRVVAPDHRLTELLDLPEEDWSETRLLSGVWTIFPNISIASFYVGDRSSGGVIMQISQLFPADNPDTSFTHQMYFAKFEPDEKHMELINTQKELNRYVVAEEDYFTGNRIQKTVKTGAKTHFIFGRNEEGCQRLHRWTDSLIDAKTEKALLKLYEKGID